MPENYLQPVRTKKSIPWVYWVAGGALIVILAAVGAYIFLQPSTPEAPTPVVHKEQNVPATTQTPTTEGSQPQTPTTTTQINDGATPIARDQQRYFDIGQIQTALKLYFADNGSYPIEANGRPLSASVGALTTAGFRSDNPAGARIYLQQLPNPPAGDAYFYRSADGKDYTLTFTLENGIAKLAAGTHHASSTGIDADTKVEDNTTKSFRSTADSDNDGLTDTEEALYGTDPKNADTDGDGYADGHEIENGYSPLLKGNAKWRDSGKVNVYTNPTYNYSLLYPAKWTVQAADIQNKEVTFISSDEQQYFSLKREDNPKGLTPLLWYQGLGKKDWNNMRTVKISGLSGLISPDGLNLYLGGGENKPMYVFTYHTGLRTDLDYFFTFTMMQNSFVVTSSDVTNSSTPDTQSQNQSGSRQVPQL